MAILSKLTHTLISNKLSITLLGGSFLAWAVFYDNYRRSKPDYLKNLVEKRREQLRERRRMEDPDYFVKQLEICEASDPMAIQQYMMSMMMEGEKDIEAGRSNEGCSKIAMGIAHMPAQQVQMVFMQLAQTLPASVVANVKARYYPAKARVQTKMMEEMMERQRKAREAQQSALERAKENEGPVIQEITEGEQKTAANNDEPDDVDSIDGDESHSIEVKMKEAKQTEEAAEPPKVEAKSQEEAEDVDSLDGDEQEEVPAGEELAEAIESAIQTVDTTELPDANTTETNTTQDEATEEQDTKELVEEPIPEASQTVENLEEKPEALETSEHEILQAESTPPAEMIQEMNNFLSQSVSNSQGDAVVSEQKNADQEPEQIQEEVQPAEAE